MLKKIVCATLAFISALVILSVAAFAKEMPTDEFTPGDSVTVVKSGVCGDMGNNVTWTQYSDGTVVITGNGKMASFASSGSTASPWNGSEAVTKVIVCDGVERLGNYAFSKCPNLTSITLPDGLKAIGAGSLYNCTSLREVDIPFTVTSINNYAFSGCSSLTSVTIPSSVTTIYDGTFNYCSSLSQVVLTGNSTTIKKGAFYGSDLVTICSYNEDSPKAEAEKLGVPFEYYVLPGDTDFDYQITENDLPYILNVIQAITEPADNAAENSDIYKDSVIDIRDFNILYNIVTNKVS